VCFRRLSNQVMLSGEHNSCTDSSIGSAPSSFVPSKWANWLSSHRNLVRHGDIHKCEIVTTVYNTSKEKNTIKPKLSSLQYCAIFACVVCRNKVQRAIYMRFCQTPIACTHCLCCLSLCGSVLHRCAHPVICICSRRDDGSIPSLRCALLSADDKMLCISSIHMATLLVHMR
jgi:hypothetical protein